MERKKNMYDILKEGIVLGLKNYKGTQDRQILRGLLVSLL